MLSFIVHPQTLGSAGSGERGADPPQASLRSVLLLGTDGNPCKSTIVAEGGVIRCEKPDAGTAALSLLHPCGDLGELSLRTCLLPERDEPYLLELELARHRLMLLFTKLEEWAMFDLGDTHPVTRRAGTARARFIEALCLQKDDPAAAALLGQQALEAALDGTEELALAHSELLLNRRRSTGAVPRQPVGVGVTPRTPERLRSGLADSFDFVQLPVPWRLLCPEENGYDWALLDGWLASSLRRDLQLTAGPLLSFEPSAVPDWLTLFENDFDTLRELCYEHVERVIRRYGNRVRSWNVLAGIHLNDHYPFSFEQLMDLTRMTAMLVRKHQPQAKLLVEIRQPFGEYYAENQRSIPPLVYADLITQSAIPFDAFQVHLPLGQALPGQYTRDLMQISCLLEEYAVFGKPLQVTVGVPSEPVTSAMMPPAADGRPADDRSGHWRRRWSTQVQSHFLEAVFQIALSKPFVEAVAWIDLIDHPDMALPMSGLLTEDVQVKDAFRRLATFRDGLKGRRR
ncbi:hypothetical protein [Phycisphaera mikurensis]|uniref:GH10 domain-containing protein n=1 Tax=Phycisphaera mikurensis (strain NBRC 102666 / KCTC 22515 / FYK2301M01) TaxID=1142394 RepID=I0IGG8_PHYMF|nr:hypothetical protein [Phycisphaera mikurensis]MBB6442961.1 hypothetical protein [Phycisphaera mikurensis]BAM04356.1 hypothetical protein PSMK_21970 [Phycisphaera mikurensis NBRC 102666]